MHTTPKRRREMVQRFNEVRKDELKVRAYEIVAAEFGCTRDTVAAQIKLFRESEEFLTQEIPAKRETFEVLASADFEMQSPVIPTAKTTLIPTDGNRILEMVASDIHFPYEDAAAYQLFLDVATELQPDVLILLGDIMDCYAVSAHDKDANRGTPAAFKEELLYTRVKRNEIKERLPNARVIYKEGNHETRLSRYITKNAAVLSNLSCVTLPELLGLAELKIEWIGNDERLRVGKMWHIHGNEVAGAGMSPARLKYSRMQCSFIFGHHHQRDKHRPRAYDGSQHGAYANPCLCDLEPEYLHHAHSWSHGFTLIDHDTDGTFQVEETEVIKPHTRARSAKCNVRGRIYNVDLDQ